jgi:hypothetical protein
MNNNVTLYHYRVVRVNDELEVQVKPLTGKIKTSPYNSNTMYYSFLDGKSHSYINVDKLDTLLSSTLSMYSLSPNKTKWFLDKCYGDKYFKFMKLKEEYIKLGNLVEELLALTNKI